MLQFSPKERSQFLVASYTYMDKMLKDLISTTTEPVFNINLPKGVPIG